MMIDIVDAAQALLERRQARSSLIDYAQYTLPGYDAAPHLREVADSLEAVERGDIKNLIIMMPPRHGKTELASVRFPGWYLGRNPQKQIIAASHSENLAYTNSLACRTVLESPTYQRLWPTQLSRSGALRWQIEGKINSRPSYIAAGVCGGITGEGADLFLIDDPIKDALQAYSETYRERIWRWYTMVARTRLQPHAAVVLILTHWHQDDLAGRLLQASRDNPNGDQWSLVKMPAISASGEALWSSRYPIEELRAIQALDHRSFQALYQQEPVDTEGEIFRREWWQYYDDAPGTSHTIQFWDTALEKGEGHSRSACVEIGVSGDHYYVSNCFARHLEYPELREAVKALYYDRMPYTVVIEKKVSGHSIIQEIKRELDIPIIGVTPRGDKEARANAISGIVQAGRVHLPRSAPWLDEFRNELASFPAGEYNDIVDAFSGAMIYLRSTTSTGMSSGRKSQRVGEGGYGRDY
ncbi:MAG: phage terminase large subunit [Chloroflexota bacterium]|nr:phage terminase large subunit [Chloroflexota bacterium]